ncbi:hypothetical protein [Paraliomyxa miuraensis]|uniref:hypothetical protein n=1 Tax=Paraliomyxa miuraensis TaxID=376150 RepID=UPI002254F317|nr:hypothetical protein [Paraliomyxa miuraensis]MCX4247486.1 hypothetical protein [Paraliomyxa miuraensis]
MLSKLFLLLLLGAVVTRVFLHAQWKGLGLWLRRCVDFALMVFVLIYAIELLVLALR